MQLATTSPQTKIESLRFRFRELFKASPHICRAPARVNLIGEHTDYNDGFVMPAAIGYYTWVGASRRSDKKVLVHSEHFKESVELDLCNLAGPPRRHWSDYVRGVAAELKALGNNLVGANLLIDSEVPLGAGLSSSAALELSVALALAKVSDIELPRLELVKLSQRAEHKYAGTLCGIMDQFVTAFGQAGRALMLDCRSLEYRPLPIPDDVRLVICNSMVRHDLASGEYNKRRADCEAGVRELHKYFPDIAALRDVSSTQLEERRTSLPDEVYRRCRHVVTENERVQSAAKALMSGDSGGFGQLMYASHESLRKDYEVSCFELDTLVEIASTCKGVHGARMTGGGFGGCSVNLVQSESVRDFEQEVSRRYRMMTNITPQIFVRAIVQGAGPVE